MHRRSFCVSGVMLLVVAVVAFETGHHSAAEKEVGPSARTEPTIHVKAVPIRAGQMERTWTLFGTVSPLSSTVHTYSLPFETRIDRLHVAGGQHVDAQIPLFDSSRSLVAKVAAEAATDFLKEAKQSLRQVKGRESDGLATREETIQAEGRFRRAEQQVAAMRQSRQLDESLTTRSSMAGIVANPGTQVGALIPAGAAIVSIAEDASIGVQLWAEPAKARTIQAGMTVSVESLANASPVSVQGHVLRVDERVDNISRLVRISVVLEPPGALLLGQNVRGRIAVNRADGFIVPRESLVASNGLSWVYTVEGGHARARRIDVIVEGDDEILIHGEGLENGAKVITRGAYQSENGLRVEMDR